MSHDPPTASDAGDPATWPPELDALVAAARHHRLILENDRVRVLETRIPPGETTELHTHAWSGVQVVKSWSDFVRTDGDGAVLLDTRVTPMEHVPEALWTGPIGIHAVENVGDADLVVVAVEIKSLA